MILRLTLLSLLFAASGSLTHATEIWFYQRGYVAGGADPATTLTDSAVARFMFHHPGIRVKIIGVPWGKEGDLKLRTALLARRRIDIFRLAHDQLPSFIPRHGRLLSPVGPYLTAADRADFGPSALKAVTYGGQIIAWPLWSTAMSLIANREILKSRGIVPPVGRPWTWDEFTDVLRRVTQPPAADQPVWGLNAAARPPLMEWFPLLMAHCGPLLTEDALPAPDSSLPLAPGLAQALEKVCALREAGLLAPSFGVDDQPAAWDSFLKGRVAFLMSSPAFIKTLAGKNIPFLILPPPTGESGRPITFGGLGCCAVVESGDPARIAAAHELARYLTSAEIAAEVPGWYLAPPARASVKTFYDDPLYRPLARILPTAHYLATPLSAGFLEGTLIPKLQAALLGQTTPERAIEDIQNAARRQALR